MVTIEPLAIEHFARLDVQAAQRFGIDMFVDQEYQRQLVEVGGWAAVAGEKVTGIGGLVAQGGGRAIAWSWLADGISEHFVGLHRAVLRVIRASGYRRVEMAVDPDQQAGQRWALLLGFDFEAPMRAWFPDGREAYLFARIQ